MTTINRAWKLESEPMLTRTMKLVVPPRGMLSPEDALALEQRWRRGDIAVTIDRIDEDIEDEDRNVVTDPNFTYRVLGDGLNFYLIET